MFKRMVFAALLALMVLGALPTAAQSSHADWSAYLYENSTQQLVRVSLDGTQKSYTLNLSPDVFVGQDSMDFTPDGNHFAYCALSGKHAELFVKDLVTPEAQSLDVDLGTSQGCWVQYSADGTEIALGLVRYLVDDPSADKSQAPWLLLVFDAATGKQLYALDPRKMGTYFTALKTIMPDVRSFANDQIIFAAIRWGGPGILSAPAYFWQLGSKNVQPFDHWGEWNIATLAQTGELVWPDEGQAALILCQIPVSTTVKIEDKTGVARTIFFSSDWELTGTAFIDNGQRLAVHERLHSGSSRGCDAPTRWVVLDRSGTITELSTTTTGFSQLAGAPNGYVYLWASDNSATPVLTLDYHTGTQKVTLWTQQESNSISWSLLWTAPTSTADNLQPFPAVTQ